MSGTTPAIGLITLGGMALVAGYTNRSLLAVFQSDPTPNSAGNTGGGVNSPVTGPADAGWGAGVVPSGKAIRWPAGGAKGFRGPNKALLLSLVDVAQNTYGLTITATTNGGHVPGSYHYSGRAFDASGSEANMHGFSEYCKGMAGQLKELIHNPGYGVKDGRVVNGASVFAAVWAGHRDHVHVAA